MNTMIHLCWVFQHAFFRRCLLVCCTRVAVCAILRVDMKHNTPQLQYSPCADLAALFSQAAEEETDVEFVLFENLTLTEGDFPGLTFRNCRFTGCRIKRHCAGARRTFIDCVLEHCDCSNVNLQKASLERTRLSDCKLVGATLSEAFLLDVSLIDCIARYSNFSSSKIRHTRFTDCDLSHAALGGCKLAKTAFERYLLIRAGCFKHRLPAWISPTATFPASRSAAGSCEMRVNLEQAAQLGVLLAGVVLAEAALPRETN